MKTLKFVFLILTAGSHFASADDLGLRIVSISMFRTEVQFEKTSSLHVEVDNKILASSYTDHKCLLVVTKVSGNKVTADAALCPGFGTLKKGDLAKLTSLNEDNEEVRLNPRAVKNKNIKDQETSPL